MTTPPRVTQAQVLAVPCPACLQVAGRPCWSPAYVCRARLTAAEREARVAARATRTV